MAAGRESGFVHRYFQDDHPAIFKLLEYVGREADQTAVGICGELAGQCNAVQALLRTGIRILSVSPPLVPSVKEAVRSARVFANRQSAFEK
jgi:phosphoenolpyruvate-protein kinase (PTS system EI component)